MRLSLLLLFFILAILPAIAEFKEVTRTGTAFVVHPDGYMLTCDHLIWNADEIKVSLNGKTYIASVLGSDSVRDIALLQIQANELPFIYLTNSNTVQLGQEIRAAGFPLAGTVGNDLKLTRGTISGVTTISTRKTFQIDAPINPGNSGGPLVNENGEAVGIISAKIVEEKVENTAFAVPVNYARQLLRDEFVEIPANLTGQKLDGIALAKHIAPAVALLTIKATEYFEDEEEGDGAEDVEEYIPDVLKAKRIELIDEKGNPTAALWTSKDGTFLSVWNTNCKAMSGIGIYNDGETLFSIWNNNGKERIRIQTGDKYNDFRVIDDNGKPCATLGMQKLPGLDDSVNLGLFSSNSLYSTFISVDDKSASMSLDKKECQRWFTFIRNTTTPLMSFYDETNKLILTLPFTSR